MTEPPRKQPTANALLDAVLEGDLEALRALLDDGADPNASDRVGNTALKLAVQLGRMDLLEFLLTRGAEPNAGDGAKSDPALFRALTSFEVEPRAPFVKRLLHAGADPNARMFDGRTPLHVAVGAPGDDGLACVRLLLAAGADPRAADDGGYTPLALAGSDEVRALLEEAEARASGE